mmetsp:Transcript_61014/g.108845  ORF Transcript_61014/g.108845 Transcript_61014/m.108845 type:complete len:362 (-) Transcript_61014:109-1194(-)
MTPTSGFPNSSSRYDPNSPIQAGTRGPSKVSEMPSCAISPATECSPALSIIKYPHHQRLEAAAQGRPHLLRTGRGASLPLPHAAWNPHRRHPHHTSGGWIADPSLRSSESFGAPRGRHHICLRTFGASRNRHHTCLRTFGAPRRHPHTCLSTFGAPGNRHRTCRRTFGAPRNRHCAWLKTFGAPRNHPRTCLRTFGAPRNRHHTCLTSFGAPRNHHCTCWRTFGAPHNHHHTYLKPCTCSVQNGTPHQTTSSGVAIRHYHPYHTCWTSLGTWHGCCPSDQGLHIAMESSCMILGQGHRIRRPPASLTLVSCSTVHLPPLLRRHSTFCRFQGPYHPLFQDPPVHITHQASPHDAEGCSPDNS